MYINISNIYEDSKWKSPSKPYRDTLMSTSLNFSVNTTLKLDDRFRFQDLYKKISSSTADWFINPLASNYGVIRGYVTENAEPIANCFVYLYQKSNGSYVSYAITNSEGLFEITALAYDVQYFIVAVYPSRKYNAVVLDDVRLDSRKEYNINV